MKTSTSFALQHHYWEKKSSSKSTPPTTHWDLRLDIPENPGLIHFYLLEDPTGLTELKVELKPWADRKWLTEEGKYPPGTPVNPSKDLFAVIKGLDRGPITVVKDTPQIKEIVFNGNIIKGTWRLTKDPEPNKWAMKKLKT